MFVVWISVLLGIIIFQKKRKALSLFPKLKKTFINPSLLSTTTEYRAIFHSDCVQTIGHYPLTFSELKVHFASASAHKFHGPKGVGLLYIKESIPFEPLLLGGGQERNFRAGNENVSGIIGMTKALNLSYEKPLDQIFSITAFKEHFISRLINTFPEVSINGGPSALYSVLSVSFPKTQITVSLLLNLNLNGICASGGSACSGGASHVMDILGTNENYTTIRFSLSKHNSTSEIDNVVAVLKNLLQAAVA